MGDSKNGDVINMAGNRRVTVVELLIDSSLVWFIHSCSCRESTETLQKSAFDGILAKDLWKIAVYNNNTNKSLKNEVNAEKKSILTIILI